MHVHVLPYMYLIEHVYAARFVAVFNMVFKTLFVKKMGWEWDKTRF